MYNLRVTVEKIEGFCDLPMRIGEYFEVKGSAIYVPEGNKICLWALQSLLPFLPAKQRSTETTNDWLPKTKRLVCPDPNGRVIFRVDLVDPKTGMIVSDEKKKFRLVVNEKDCIECRLCEKACAEHNEISRIKVMEDGINVCRQCGTAPCIEVCKYDALYRNEFGAVVVDESKCVLCEACIKVCPFNAILLLNKKILICTLCGGKPECVDVCPTSAIKFENLTQKI
ncbi:MAG: hypothetical protein PWQ20_1868 [Thermotogaceae bacterium]|nr:hypothetical protein [Thermotogaceae bacterium]MDN5338798.1 hypothetical protein [Thermotogaceae bacterium]